MSDFNKLVDRMVLDLLVAEPFSDFGALLKLLPGVYPQVLLDSIERIPIDQNRKFSLILSSAVKPPEQLYLDGLSFLPNDVPHPLDYEWHFTKSSVRELLSLVNHLTPSGGTIALLGTPTLYKFLDDQTLDKEVLLIDNNSHKLASLYCFQDIHKNLKKCNLLRDPIPEIEADCVVSDPPWYMEHFEAFIWAAAQVTVLDGYLIICIPPVGAKHNADAERESIFSITRSYGFSIEGIYPNYMRYVMPPFEKNSLSIGGINNIPIDWRSCDIAILCKQKDMQRPRPIAFEEGSNWDSHLLDNVKLRVKMPIQPILGDPRLYQVVDGDILGNVSRSNPQREKADIWTSGNRVFKCESKYLFIKILESLYFDCPLPMCIDGLFPYSDLVEYQGLVSEAMAQVKTLVATENKEYTYYRFCSL